MLLLMGSNFLPVQSQEDQILSFHSIAAIVVFIILYHFLFLLQVICCYKVYFFLIQQLDDIIIIMLKYFNFKRKFKWKSPAVRNRYLQKSIQHMQLNLISNQLCYYYFTPVSIPLGRSPFSECESCYCKIRSLSMCSISCCTRSRFSFIHVTEKKVKLAWTFFQLLSNDVVKVDKTQRIPTKIVSAPKFGVELRKIEEKDKIMKTSYAMFQIREAVICRCSSK